MVYNLKFHASVIFKYTFDYKENKKYRLFAPFRIVFYLIIRLHLEALAEDVV